MYHVAFTPAAHADLARLDKPIAQRVLKKLRWLAEHFELITPEPLTGEQHGVFKLRVGDYRVLYTLTERRQKLSFTLSSTAVRFTKRDSVGRALRWASAMG